MPYPSRRYKPRVAVTRKRRAAYGAYRGRGLYTGRGSFFDSVKKRAGQVAAAYQKYIPQGERDMLRAAAMGVRDAGIQAAKSYVGMGSYNELVKGSRYVTPEAITMRSKGDETSSVCVTNKEYIGDLYGPDSQSFVNTSYPINPGLTQVFPWLSQIAANYDEYEFEQLVFEYHPTISETSTATSGQSGTIILVTNYNPSQDPFSDKEAMMQYHGGQSDRVTAESIHGVECDPKKSSQGRRYTRTQPVIVGQDAKNFDLGLFQIGINNIPESYFNQQLGELWVHYKVHLHVPKLGSGRGNSINQDFFLTANGSTRENMFFAAQTLRAQQNSIGCKVDAEWDAGDDTSTVTITFPAGVTGNYDVKLMFISTSEYYANLETITTDGNVVLKRDLYPVRYSTGEQYLDIGAGGYPVPANCMIELHAEVKSSTGGLDNAISIGLQHISESPVGVGEIWGQGFISVVERNDSFSQSKTSDQYVWLDAAGNVQVPAGVYGV